MSLATLLDKLKGAADKMSAVTDRVSNVASAKSQVTADKEKLDALKDKAPGMESRKDIAAKLAAKAGKPIPTTPTVDVSPESIVGKI